MMATHPARDAAHPQHAAGQLEARLVRVRVRARVRARARARARGAGVHKACTP